VAIESTNMEEILGSATARRSARYPQQIRGAAERPYKLFQNKFCYESPAKLPIELGSSPQGRLDMAVEFCKAARCDEGWKCDCHTVT